MFLCIVEMKKTFSSLFVKYINTFFEVTSKAIGKSGINIRLASMLTGMQIELEETDEISSQGAEVQEKKDNVDALEALFN